MREWKLSVLARLSGETNAKWTKLYIQAGVKPKLLYKHNEEWEKSRISFLLLVIENTYLLINSNNWLANKRLLSQLKARVGPLSLEKSLSFGGRKKASKKNEVVRTSFHQENHLTRQTLPISSFRLLSLCQSLTFFFNFVFYIFLQVQKYLYFLLKVQNRLITSTIKFILSFFHFINIDKNKRQRNKNI